MMGLYLNCKLTHHVEVPQSTIEIADHEINSLLDGVNPLENDNEHGIVLYENAKMALSNILSKGNQ